MIYRAVASVIRVTDGDTVETLLDIGWGIILRPRGKSDGPDDARGGPGTIRVVGRGGVKYDAPERGTEHGRQARAVIAGIVAPGAELAVTSYGLDDFGRTLGAVTLPDGQDWAAFMTTLGYVKAAKPAPAPPGGHNVA